MEINTYIWRQYGNQDLVRKKYLISIRTARLKGNKIKRSIDLEKEYKALKQLGVLFNRERKFPFREKMCESKFVGWQAFFLIAVLHLTMQIFE